jgi:predicted membrane-bound mannosyltransferase/DNA-binding beta-propeller fold protein YncE
MQTEETNRSWLDRPLHPSLPALTYEILIFASIVAIALLSRFYDLGLRVMSHDESLHTYFSWLLYKGQGYQHTPMMHGPLQFHLLALSYFLFGVSDFTARIPAALFSIATIWMMWYWRRYLGKAGALIAAALLLISPYMLFYGRYTRNEAFVGLFGILTLYAMLRYLETGLPRYLYLLTAAVALHFTAKETAFIYTAQALLFLLIYFIAQVSQRRWANEKYYRVFILFMTIGILLVGIALGFGLYTRKLGTLSGSETVAPLNPTQMNSPLANAAGSALSPTLLLGGIGLIALLAAACFLIVGYGWKAIRTERSFGMLIVLVTMVLPQLAAFPVKLAGWDPLDYSPLGLEHTAIFLVPLALIALAIGLLWNRDLWLKSAALFYGIFILFYTTVFTNGQGFFTGLVGSLGYWLAQQGVQRGSQPWYYYLLIQIPVYEFLPALGSLLALGIGIRRRRKANHSNDEEVEPDEEHASHVPALGLVGWWVVTSLLAYTVAGEKMPWLTYHIAWPMILLSGCALGQLVEHTDWAGLRQRRAPLVLTLTLLFLCSFASSLWALTGITPPFQGKDLVQLQATATFTLSALVAIASGGGLLYLLRDWSFKQVLRTSLLTFFALLAVLTGRTAFRAAYINYDNATEYLVYAHAARGVKDIMAQAQEISERTAGDLNVAIAYDASSPDTGVSWPFVWYLHDYTNQRSFDQPSRSLRDETIIIVDQKNFSKIEPVVEQGYFEFDYIRMWWPNQDYFGLTKDRLIGAITDPQIRAGILNIWLNRDYTQYAQATGSQTITLTNWEPSDRMRMYIRKDVVQQIWNYGVGPAAESATITDPYESGTISLPADLIIGSQGQGEAQFDAPRAIAFAPDGTFYVADSRNNRIQHFAANGGFLNTWSTFTQSLDYQVPEGPTNEPWGVAVGPDGSVYVADTWNYRIEKYSPDGRLLTTWGHYGLAEQPDAFWGPRGIAVDKNGHVYVADTGNKRIVVFDSNGQFLTQFGSPGLDAGQFDEPVGVAVDADGVVYVTDTWNQRIQTFSPSPDGLVFTPLKQWVVSAWYGQSLDNKPFIAVDDQKHVFVTDPEGYRVLEFSAQGDFIRAWGEYGDGPANFGLAAGIAIDQEGHIWVTDAGNNRIMRFSLPTASSEGQPSPAPSSVPISPIPSPEVVLPPASCKVFTQYRDGWLTLRSCAGHTCPAIAWLPEGSELSILPTAPVKNWIPVQIGDTVGWVNGVYCRK